MNDNYTIKHTIEVPRPRKREPLERYRRQSYNWESVFKAMSKKKGKSPYARTSNSGSSSSSPNTPSPHATPDKDLNSSGSGNELRKQRASTGSPRLYPDLSEFEGSDFTDKSFNLILEKSSDRQSVGDTQTPNSSYSLDYSSHKERTLYNTSILETHKKVNRSRQKESNHNGWILAFIAVAISFIIGGIYHNYYPLAAESNENKIVVDEGFKNNLASNISELKRDFPSQDNGIWSYFTSGIADVRSKRNRPGIFVLIGTHPETTNCLAKKVAELARSSLRGTGDVILSPDKFENDIGKALDLMKNRIEKTKAVATYDLLSFQPEAIKSLHDVCDQYSPLVPEAVYLFTMHHEMHEKSNPSKVAEQQLKNKFSADIKEDTLIALIVRITAGAVLFVNEEKDIPCAK